MSNSKKILILTGAAVLLSATLATPSFARGCRCGAIRGYHSQTRNVVKSEHNDTRSQIRSSIEQQTDDLRDHMDINTEELIEGLMGQARENSNFQQLQVEASQRIEDASEVNATNRLRDEFRAKAESGNYDPNPYSCLLLDLFGSESSGSGGGSSPEVSGSTVLEDVSDYLSGDDPIVKGGGTGLSKHISDKHDEYTGFLGSKSGDTDWGLLASDSTIDLEDPKMAEVAELIVRNTLDSTPDRPVTDAEKLTPAGLDRIAKSVEKSARLAAAGESIKMTLNMRTPVLTGAPIETYRKMVAESAYNRGELPNTISELQQIDITTIWHYAPIGKRQEVLSNSGGMNVQGWLYELHRITSLLTRINYIQLELASRDAVVNAAILATLNDDD